MLDRLPRELLDYILRLASPPRTLTRKRGNARLTFLCRLCLLCKAVSPAAQSLLWRDLDLDELDAKRFTVQLYLGGVPAPLLDAVRSFTIRCETRSGCKTAETVFACLPEVKEVVLVLAVDMANASTLIHAVAPTLTRFWLDVRRSSSLVESAGPVTFGPRVVFPKLTHMRLCGAKPDHFSPRLTPTVFPSLRILVLDQLHGRYFSLSVGNGEAEEWCRLVARLDAVQTPDQSRCLHTLPLTTPGSPLVFTSEIWHVADSTKLEVLDSPTTLRSTLHHLFLDCPLERLDFLRLTNFNKTATKPPFHSIHLPPKRLIRSAQRQLLDEFTQAAQARGTEVVWRSTAEEMDCLCWASGELPVGLRRFEKCRRGTRRLAI
ncbi:hypothetical protein JCM8097_002683 [Rhodosporidiobolus ruineniae]